MGPKRYPALQRGEVTFTGAGIVPLCMQNDVSYALVQKRLRGSKNPVLFYDFGGKKKPGKKENVSACACRHFAKQTYGLFGMDTDCVTPDDLTEVFHGKDGTVPALPLMMKTCEDWAMRQVIHGDRVFMQSEQNYFFYVIEVPYVEPSLLNAASNVIDGKREFHWIECDELFHRPIAGRLHVNSFQQAASLGFVELFGEMELVGRSEYSITHVADESE